MVELDFSKSFRKSKYRSAKHFIWRTTTKLCTSLVPFSLLGSFCCCNSAMRANSCARNMLITYNRGISWVSFWRRCFAFYQRSHAMAGFLRPSRPSRGKKSQQKVSFTVWHSKRIIIFYEPYLHWLDIGGTVWRKNMLWSLRGNESKMFLL